MATNNGSNFSSGDLEGTGEEILIETSFRPRSVTVNNVDGQVVLVWNSSMSDDTGFKTVNSSGAPTFTGTTPTGALNVATPVISGTGFDIVDTVLTTTQNFTVSANQLRGMWLVCTGTTYSHPHLILSNSASTNAPITAIVSGLSLTNASTFIIVNSPAPVGTISGAGGVSSQILSGGITPFNRGFIIGTDSDLNVEGELLTWTATR